MVFLIEYARSEGRTVAIREFQDSDRLYAEDARLDLELRLNRERVKHEVVLLEAESEDVLRRTHGRYFDEIIEWPEGPLPEQLPPRSRSVVPTR